MTQKIAQSGKIRNRACGLLWPYKMPKNQVETYNKSADPQSCYKRISPREGAITALIMLGKSSKPIAGMLKHTLRTAVICRTHLAELMVI